MAIIGINAAYCANAKMPKDALYIQKTPTCKLLAKAPIAIGEAVFVAWTHHVKLVTKDDGGDNSNVVTVGGKYKFQMDKPDMKKHLLVEFWRVGRTDSEKYANMKIEMIDRNVPVPSIARYEVTTPTSVSIPSAVVTKNVKVGDELILHVPVQKKDSVKRGIAMEFKPTASTVQPKKKARGM